MGCGTVTIKYLLFIVNLIFAVGGLALVITGSLIMSNITKFKEVLAENMGHHAYDLAVFNVVVGSIVLLIAFFGCCGAIQESHCMVITYSVLMCIILLVQLICGFFVHIHTSEIVNIVEEEMETQMVNYNKSGTEGRIAKKMWDDWQQDFHCCGIRGPQDWGSNIPSSCKRQDPSHKNNDNSLFMRGCHVMFVDEMHYLWIAIKVFAGIVAIIEIIAIVFACHLGAEYRRSNQYRVFSPTSDGQTILHS